MGSIHEKLEYTKRAKIAIYRYLKLTGKCSKADQLTENTRFTDWPYFVRAIKPKPERLIITQNNRTYTPSSETAMITEVIADEKSDVMDIEITDNGAYSASSYNVVGFQKITVNTPNDGGGLVDLEITQPGFYDAEAYGAGGFSSIIIKRTHTVSFRSNPGDVELQSVIVPHGDEAEYDGQTPTRKGYRFVGWNPMPTNVISDLVCYAIFEQPQYK